jgi:hypothetical protein
MQNENQTFQNQPPAQPQGQVPMQVNLPNATAVLVLGILSIVVCWCWGIVGAIMAVIALVLAGKDISLYNANPSQYTAASFKNVKTGKICAIIGLILSGLYLIFVLIYVFIIGAAITTLPWELYKY